MVAALVDTFAGYFNSPLMTAAVVVDGSKEWTGLASGAEQNALFEAGSVGKTMTAIVTATMVIDGTLDLDDPIGRWLDAGANADITIGQLATHTSGLPRLAPNAFEWPGFKMDDPYAGFTADVAELGLRAADRGKGGAKEYSNFGFQLLGLLLCRAAELEFGPLYRRQLFEPLGMATATIAIDDRVVQGYAGDKPVGPWRQPLPGAGGIMLAVGDLAAYLRALLHPPDDPVGAAIELSVDRGLAWSTTADGLTWKNGGTAGFHSALFADRRKDRGAAAMVNNAALTKLDDAVARAARGKDPRAARPVPAGDAFDQPALDAAAHCIRQEWTSLRALMTKPVRELLTAERMSQGWASVMTPRGDVTAVDVTRSERSSGRVEVEVTLTFADSANGTILLYYDDDTRITGILIG